MMEINSINIADKKAEFFPIIRDNNTVSDMKKGKKSRYFKLSGVNKKPSLKEKAFNNKEELKKSCSDFEAILLNFLLTEMRKTVKKNNLFGEANFSSETFTSMLDSEISKNIAGSGALGISENMYNQLTTIMPGTRRGISHGK